MLGNIKYSSPEFRHHVSVNQEMNQIPRIASRITRCIIEYFYFKRDVVGLQSAIILYF